MSTGTIINAAPIAKGSAARIVAALSLSVIGIAGSVQLLRVHLISEASFVLLASGAVLLGIIVAFIDRVLKLSFKDLSVEFAKIEEARVEVEGARKEVEQREKEVARIAMAMAELTNFIAAFQGRWGSDRSNQLQKEWLKFRSKKLLDESGVSGDDIAHASRWLTDIERMDSMKGEQEGEKEWERIWDRVEEEIKEANKSWVSNRT